MGGVQCIRDLRIPVATCFRWSRAALLTILADYADLQCGYTMSHEVRALR